LKRQLEDYESSFKFDTQPNEEVDAHDLAFVSLEVEFNGSDNPVKDFMSQFHQPKE
jgi:hypothetical protein